MEGGVKEFEKLIYQVRDVISARINTGEDGGIEEIHVLARSDRNPRQIVRDIESAFRARYGMLIDQKKISIAQIKDDREAALTPARLRLVSVSLTINGTRARARVELLYGTDRCEGTTEGPASSVNRLRLIAAATLNAIEGYFRNEAFFSVEDLILVDLGGRQGVVVSVSIISPAGEESFMGSAFVGPDEREAVARATLDAINRQFALVVRKEVEGR